MVFELVMVTTFVHVLNHAMYGIKEERADDIMNAAIQAPGQQCLFV